MRNSHYFLTVFFLSFLSMAASANDLMVEVFWDSNLDEPIVIPRLPGVQLVDYDLSAPERVNEQFLPQLPGNPDEALRLMKRFMASDEGKAYQVAVRDAHQGQAKVASYQLTKVPAVVFEQGKYVIYGNADIVQAIGLYRATKRDEVNGHE